MDTSVIVCGDSQHIARRAMDLLIDELRSGIHLRGEAHLALTGGSSAAALFALLRSDPRAQRVDWRRVHVWQGDERFVSPTSEDSNWSAALRGWLEAEGGPDIPAGQLHPIPVGQAIAEGHGPAWAARRYAEEMERLLPRREGLPSFDVVLLGVGIDGHIFSAFPETAAIDEEHEPVLAIEAPTHIEPQVPRVTLAPFLLRAAGLVIVMVPGIAKATVVAMCFDTPIEPQRLPAQLAIRPNAVWLLETRGVMGT